NGTDGTPPSDLRGAELSIGLQASPSMLSVGQELRVEVTVKNTGDTTASSVMPSTPLQTGSGHATLKESPLPTDLKPGESQLFTFVYSATDSGSISFEVGADGTDLVHDRAVMAAPV